MMSLTRWFCRHSGEFALAGAVLSSTLYSACGSDDHANFNAPLDQDGGADGSVGGSGGSSGASTSGIAGSGEAGSGEAGAAEGGAGGDVGAGGTDASAGGGDSSRDAATDAPQDGSAPDSGDDAMTSNAN